MKHHKIADDSPLSETDLRLTEDDLPYSDGMPMETERHVSLNGGFPKCFLPA